ncbi:MAG: redox-regulated ATPase YchF [Candidatus ainarchaeum sp.]|nr:redox-regulated ATPase YchF [Candidatus ainarchaeum sp.]
MQIGIVGKPSCGKSTLFSAATLMDVGIASYPFTTIEPNKGTAFIRVEDAGKYFGVISNPRSGFLLNENNNPIRYVPIELIDVAGLVPGANEGKGLGNKFLNDLSQADALIHVVDASGSTNEEGNMVAPGSHDPCKDVEFLEREIELWFLKIIENNWAKFGKVAEKDFKKKVIILSQHLSGIKILTHHIEKALRDLKIDEKMFSDWTIEDKTKFAKKCRELSKPIIIAANKCDMPTSEENIKKMKERFNNLTIIPCSAASELSLRKAAKAGILKYYPGQDKFEIIGELNEKQKEGLEVIDKTVLKKFNGTGIQKCLDETVLNVLNYIPIFPGGTKGLQDKEGRYIPDCFLMKRGSTALDFAYYLHSDIGDNFIKAINVKTKQIIGKDYVLEYGDVIEIVFNKR